MTALKAWMEEHKKDDAAVAAAASALTARPTGISRSQINRLKNGASKPSFETAAALEKLTGISAGQLFDVQDRAA